MKLTRKKIILVALPLVAAALIGAYFFIPGSKAVARQGIQVTKAAAAHYDLTSDVDASNVRQVITRDSTTSRTIMWQSDFSEEPALVEYRIKGSDGDVFQQQATTEAFTDDDTTTYIHSALLQDLTPGTTYEYRVGYGEKRTEWQEFQTARGNDFKALIFPDSQSSDYSVWAATVQPAWQRNSDAQFFINMGDLVDNGQDHYQWNAWFDVVGP